MAKKLPKVVFVKWHDDGWLEVIDEIKDLETQDNGKQVGVYKLVDTKTVKCVPELAE